MRGERRTPAVLPPRSNPPLQYPLNWTFAEKFCASNGIRISDGLFRDLVATEYTIVAAGLLLPRTIRVFKSGVLVLASTGITVLGRFIVRMSTPSVAKIDGLLSVSDSGGGGGKRERERERERRIASDEV